MGGWLRRELLDNEERAGSNRFKRSCVGVLQKAHANLVTPIRIEHRKIATVRFCFSCTCTAANVGRCFPKFAVVLFDSVGTIVHINAAHSSDDSDKSEQNHSANAGYVHGPL